MTDEPIIRIRDGSMVTREEYDVMEKQAQKAKANRQVKADSSLSYSDLVDWLRDNAIGVVSFRPKFIEAANAIEALMARIEDIADKYNSALLTPVTDKMLKEAVDEIVKLRARIAELEAALLTFSTALDYYEKCEPLSGYIDDWNTIKVGDLRAARPANESLQAHNPKNMGGVRMVVISLPRVKCLETGDE